MLTGGTIVAVLSLWAMAVGRPIPQYVNWLILGCVLVLSSFMAWRKQSIRIAALSSEVNELSGNPMITLEAASKRSAGLTESWFHLNSISSDGALNVEVDPLIVRAEDKDLDSLEIRFSSVPVVGPGSQKTPLPYKVLLVRSGNMEVDHSALFVLLGTTIKNKSIISYRTNVAFSNYGVTKRWATEYNINFVMDAQQIVCKAGPSRLVSG